MEQAVEPLLKAWEAVYVIVGPSAAVLIGLQFVVLVLSTEVNMPGSIASINSFGTPTIVHFCAVLLVSAIMSAPWPTFAGAGVALGLTGLVGLLYSARVVVRTRRQTSYVPVLEDWIWHCVLPVITYLVLIVAAALLQRWPVTALFMVCALMMVLLFVGIHNTWDAVIYIALRSREQPGTRDQPAPE